MKKLVLPKEAFFSEILEQIAQGKTVCIGAQGRSMLPLIHSGEDSLYLRALSESSIVPGNIILGRTNEGFYVIHRIERVEGNRITLRGDGNPYQREIIHRSGALAELVYFEHRGLRIGPKHWRWRMCQSLWPSNGMARRALLYLYRHLG